MTGAVVIGCRMQPLPGPGMVLLIESGSWDTEQRPGEGTGVGLVGKGELTSTEDIAIIQVGVMVAGIKGMVASGQKWVDSGIFERI